MRPLVYIAHELAGPNPDANRTRASRWCAWAALHMCVAPIADWIVLSSTGLLTREQGLAVDVEIVKRCDELWLCGGRLSPGMIMEARAALEGHPFIIDLIDLGPEPPPGRVVMPDSWTEWNGNVRRALLERPRVSWPELQRAHLLNTQGELTGSGRRALEILGGPS